MALITGLQSAKFDVLIASVSPLYLVLLGGRFAAAILAKVVISSADPTSRSRRARHLPHASPMCSPMMTLGHIRPALIVLANNLGVDHALASRRLFTDGAELLFDYAEQSATPDTHLARQLVVIRSGQHVFADLVQHYLKRMVAANKTPPHVHFQADSDQSGEDWGELFERVDRVGVRKDLNARHSDICEACDRFRDLIGGASDPDTKPDRL
jgi:hypothetical protein